MTRDVWIDEYGSDLLRLAKSTNQELTKQYIFERVKKAFAEAGGELSDLEVRLNERRGFNFGYSNNYSLEHLLPIQLHKLELAKALTIPTIEIDPIILGNGVQVNSCWSMFIAYCDPEGVPYCTVYLGCKSDILREARKASPDYVEPIAEVEVDSRNLWKRLQDGWAAFKRQT